MRLSTPFLSASQSQFELPVPHSVLFSFITNIQVDTAMEALSSCLVTSTSFLSSSLSSTPFKGSPYGDVAVKPLGQGTPVKYQDSKVTKKTVTPPSEGPR